MDVRQVNGNEKNQGRKKLLVLVSQCIAPIKVLELTKAVPSPSLGDLHA
jgi:hypothetical protein